jgi:hypothetical protein
VGTAVDRGRTVVAVLVGTAVPVGAGGADRLGVTCTIESDGTGVVDMGRLLVGPESEQAARAATVAAVSSRPAVVPSLLRLLVTVFSLSR